MTSHCTAIRLLRLVTIICGAAASASAQETTTPHATPWISSFSVGLPGVSRQVAPQLFTVGMNFTQRRVNRPAADLSVGTMPYGFAFMALPIGIRAGVALPLEVAPDMLLIPSAGISGVAVMSSGSAAMLGGVNGGVATVLGGTTTGGVRAGVSWHAVVGIDRVVWLAELGYVRSIR